MVCGCVCVVRDCVCVCVVVRVWLIVWLCGCVWLAARHTCVLHWCVHVCVWLRACVGAWCCVCVSVLRDVCVQSVWSCVPCVMPLCDVVDVVGVWALVCVWLLGC